MKQSLLENIDNPENLESVEQTVAKYLTVYFVWTIVVIFLFPFVFGFR